VREVRKLLEANGHIVEGPFYKNVFNPFRKVMIAVHYDPFSADLISWKKGFELHQVCERGVKSRNIKQLQLTTWIWTWKKRVKGFQRELIRKD
jgi:hypothetical protein